MIELGALIPVSPAKLLAQCQTVLENELEAVEKREREYAIELAEWENKRRQRWDFLREIFMMKPLPKMTFEESLELLREQPMTFTESAPWAEARWRASSASIFNKVEKLLEATDPLGLDPVYVSADLYAFINRRLGKVQP